MYNFAPMKASEIRRRLKPWMLPIAMLIGVICHNYMDAMAWAAPVLIFAMLLLTFCKVSPKEFRITALSWSLLAVQVVGALALYAALRPLDVDVAQGLFICVFCPTATAAPVIVGMLGGSVPRLATYSIVSNLTVAVTAPIFFTLMGSETVDFFPTFRTICRKVVPLIISPLIIAMALRALAPKAHHKLADHAGLSFYLWAISLIVVVGRAVSFVMREPASKIPNMIILAVGAAVVCVLQFVIGRRLGRRYGDKIAGAQGLGQKNTVLAIWMALTFLNPISSIAPAAYIAWQNIINSAQLYFKTKRDG
jgi:BASS family bile acid:Na+ symporter